MIFTSLSAVLFRKKSSFTAGLTLRLGDFTDTKRKLNSAIIGGLIGTMNVKKSWEPEPDFVKKLDLKGRYA